VKSPPVQVESRWSPLKYLCQVGGVSGIPHVPHGPPGFQVEFIFPCGFHVESPGIYGGG
jgi:hypothetical protein